MLVNCLGVDFAREVHWAHGTTWVVDPDPAARCCHKKAPTTTITNNTGIPILKNRRVREFIIISFLSGYPLSHLLRAACGGAQEMRKLGPKRDTLMCPGS